MNTPHPVRILVAGVVALAAMLGAGSASGADGVRVLRAWDEEVEVVFDYE